MELDCIIQDDAIDYLKNVEDNCIDLIYLDPPFFTQEKQQLANRKNKAKFSFSDSWRDMDAYLQYMEDRLKQCRRVLKESGSIFLHCDRNASHYLKIMMDRLFGMDNFQSEIVWSYRRWSNSKKGLLNNHQIIFFYSKTAEFKFNTIYTDYSVTTNVDQILQDRVRNEEGKAVYKIDSSGTPVIGKSKKGVPLSDVWEIPFLNPKAKERVGYPTQKPIILIEQIIKLVTNQGDIVLDPFVGSGTTAVAAKLLGRRYIGIDKSAEAVKLAENRLDQLVKTESHLLNKGKKAYEKLSSKQMEILSLMDATPVQRNSGIDGFLKEHLQDRPVSVKIQRESETLDEAIDKLLIASKKKQCSWMILVRTHMDMFEMQDFKQVPDNLTIVDSYEYSIEALFQTSNGAQVDDSIIGFA